VGADDFGAAFDLAQAERDFAAVRAMGADRGDVIHFPGAGLVSISTAGERAYGANIDAHAALFAVELIAVVGHDGRSDAAVADAQRPNVHAFAADAHAAIAEDAARPVKEHRRRPLLFIAMVLGLGEEAFAGAIGVIHVLKFA